MSELHNSSVLYLISSQKQNRLMKKITPYKTTSSALASLDNGGRFYNFVSKADDGEISSAELAKAAGVFSNKQQMMLYLEMAISELDASAQQNVLANLSADLKGVHKKYVPQRLVPSQAKSEGRMNACAIITGIPKLVDSKTDFNGFIMVPIVTDKVTTFVMIPIFDQYDVYELRDEDSARDFLIAHNRGSSKLPPRMVRCGGVLKELKKGKGKKADVTIFLETIYYTTISQPSDNSTP